MKVADFDYELPQELIAQRPLPSRDASRLLLLERHGGRVEHRRFTELPSLLAPGDLVVVNDTRVLPARLVGTKATGGRVELLLVDRAGGTEQAPEWDCLLKASRSPTPGTSLRLEESLNAELLERRGDRWRVRLESEDGNPLNAVERLGRIPLPPYIRRTERDPRDAEDRVRYQTIYATAPGAVAAPTAGLHFTERVLERLAERGVGLARLTLHVGPGTFMPLRSERVEEHAMHEEYFEIPRATAEAVEATRMRGGRVVAVGSTVVRGLEQVAAPGGRIGHGSGRSGLFIYPGYEFRVVDAIITNFHLPRSTLLILVCAFAGTRSALAAYREAVQERYRFYSYGDAMMVWSR